MRTQICVVELNMCRLHDIIYGYQIHKNDIITQIINQRDKSNNAKLHLKHVCFAINSTIDINLNLYRNTGLSF